jgi:hypothetical protein
MKIIAGNLRITKVVLYTLFWILIPALSNAEEEPSLAQTLNYLKEKATGFWISWDGGLFIANTEYSDFITDTKNQFLIVDEYEKTVLKSTGQVISTGWQRITIPLAELDPELIDVNSQKSFSDSPVKVFFVSLISRNDDKAVITCEGTEKRDNKPETAISNAWAECYLVFQDQDCAERLRQAVVRAIKLSNSK